MLGVPQKDHHAPTSVVPRARLAVRNAIRSTPRATATILLLMVTVLVLTLWRCSGCPEASCRPTAAAARLQTPTPVAAHRSAAAMVAALPAGESEAERVTAEAEVEAAGGKLQLAEVVVGLMTAQRFHGTRCRMQSATWLQRMRRVIFFTDSTAEAPEELQAPVLAHAFDAAPLERIFSGGNWRALPILREMAHMFFTDEAQAGFVARGEPPPRWAYMADDDAFAFHSQLLETLREYDSEEPQYLGYAFIAAPHLEGIIPGVRQPLFANGGAGIAVSRAAIRAVLPHLAKCEADYKWNWPGDIRVAQCFVDAGVKLEWVHNFHSENPHVIIEKAKPPPGSVPVGLTLPPLSFHHVDVSMLPQLERMQIVRTAHRGLPHYYDFAPFAFAPLAAETHGTQLQLHFGYQARPRTLALLAPRPPARPALPPALLCHPPARKKHPPLAVRQVLLGAGSSRLAKLGEHLASFRALPAAGGGAAVVFEQSFAGGECRDKGRLLGGMSATVRIACGGCGGEHAMPTRRGGGRGAGGLEVCDFRRDGCAAHVDLGLPAALCPRPQPHLRRGLDGGAVAGRSDVVLDGAVRKAWARGCRRGAGAACAEVDVPRGCANVTLHFRSLRGAVAVRLLHLSADSGVVVRPAEPAWAALLLPGTTEPPPLRQPTDPSLPAVAEPAWQALTLLHVCPPGVETAQVRATLEVHEHYPLRLEWRAACAQ